jgi:hypothetical protein
LAVAEVSGRQPAQGFIDVCQFPAGRDRAAEKPLYLLLAVAVAVAIRVGGSPAVAGQRQLGNLLQPCLPAGLQELPPAWAAGSGGQHRFYRQRACTFFSAHCPSCV